MNQTKFNEFVTDVRRAWTEGDGVIAVVRDCAERREPVRICVGPVTNRSELVAAMCLAWRGDTLLYKGRLDAPELRMLLTGGKYVKATITNYRRIDMKTLTYRCYGQHCTKKCPNRG